MGLSYGYKNHASKAFIYLYQSYWNPPLDSICIYGDPTLACGPNDEKFTVIKTYHSPNVSPVLFSLSIPPPPQLHSVVIAVMLVPKTWLQKHCERLLLLIRVCAIYVSTPLIIAQRLRKLCFSLDVLNEMLKNICSIHPFVWALQRPCLKQRSTNMTANLLRF